MILIEFFKIGLNDLKNFRKFIKLHIKKKFCKNYIGLQSQNGKNGFFFINF